MELRPTPFLYVFVQDGCPACAEADVHLKQVQRENPCTLMIVPLHVNRKDWRILGWRPPATPGYALVANNRLVKKHVGVMEYDELVDWLGKAIE